MGDLPIEKIHRFVDNFIHKHLTKMFYANNDDFAKNDLYTNTNNYTMPQL